MFLLTKRALDTIIYLTGADIEYWEISDPQERLNRPDRPDRPDNRSDKSDKNDHGYHSNPYILIDITRNTERVGLSASILASRLHSHLNRPFVVAVYDEDTRESVQNLGIPYSQIFRLPPDTDHFDEYISYLIGMLESASSNVFTLGTHNCTVRRPAGIFPILCHNSKLFAMLGLESRFRQYSDFGGGFDRVYSPNSHRKRESYKNAILKSYQIQNGLVHPLILVDQLLNLSSQDRQKFIQRMQDGKTGKGDLNTIYTAFREYIEETSGFNPRNGNVRYLFDINTVFRKLFVDKHYIYLRAEDSYGYDTFMLFFTVNDFCPADRPAIIRQISLIDRSPTVYLKEMGKTPSYTRQNRSSIPTSIPALIPASTADPSEPPVTMHSTAQTNGMPDFDVYRKVNSQKKSQMGKRVWGPKKNINMYQNIDAGYIIRGNLEMRRIDLFPLPELLQMMSGVDYQSYREKSPKRRNKRYWEQVHNSQHESFHADTFNAPFYDRLRPSFADALVRHNGALQNVVARFDSIRSAIL